MHLVILNLQIYLYYPQIMRDYQTLIEAQTAGIPIISSNCATGPKEILINGRLGDLFNTGDYKDLCKKILNFIKIERF